jgi:hypothetical protein
MNTPGHLSGRREFIATMGTLAVATGARAAVGPARPAMKEFEDEMLVFDHAFTWEAGKAFFCWLPIAPGIGGPGLLRRGRQEPPFEPFTPGRRTYPENWVRPNDYWSGTWQCRYEFKQRPAERPGLIQLGIWSEMRDNWKTWRETISTPVAFHGRTGVFFGDADDSPARTWWRLKKDEPVDFARVRDFTRIGFIMRNERKKVLHPAKHLGNKSGWLDRREDYYPCVLRATVVAVAAGRTFSGWSGYV